MTSGPPATSKGEYILVVGAAHPDIFADYPQDQADRIDKVGEITYSIGGTAYNIAVNIARNYVDVALFTVIKEDSLFTDPILDRLEQNGVMTNFVETSEYMSESGFIGVREEGQLISAVTASGITDVRLDEQLLEDAVESASLVVADCNLNETQLELVTSTAAAYETSVFIAGVSESKALRIRDISSSVDLFSLNEAEARAFLGGKSLSGNILKQCADTHGIQNLVVTGAEKGHTVATPESVREFSAPPISSIVSTSGTGDAFLAGVCHAVHEEDEIDWNNLNEYIHEYIEDVVSYEGSTPGATAKETELSVKERVNQRARSIAGYSWWEIAATVIGVIGAVLTILTVVL
jgi:sugar/nucleoside kinase (ribokinase family)